MTEKNINSKRSLVALLDILGYKKIMENNNPEDFYNKLNDAFKSVDKLSESLIFSDKINISLISDSIIFYLDLDQSRTPEQVQSDVLRFIPYISTFILSFIISTRTLLRGGICIGNIYQNSLSCESVTGNFLYGKGISDAYSLEQEAIYPRVIVTDEFANLALSTANNIDMSKKKDLPWKNIILPDIDGSQILNYYNFEAFNNLKPIIEEIIESNLANNMFPNDVKRKWNYFKSFYFSQIKSE